nr:unnamed protein product [Callosobruchus chinensis]
MEVEPADFKNYYRMKSETYQVLFDLVTPYIEKKSTDIRKAIGIASRISFHELVLMKGYYAAFRHPSKIGAPKISTTWVHKYHP